MRFSTSDFFRETVSLRIRPRTVGAISKFLRKFAERFESKDGNKTDDKMGKKFEIGSFFIFYGRAVYTHIMILYFIFTLSCRQADFDASVLI
jgi:hypothetical protein